ncbi:Methyltransferase-like protein 7A [Morella rubra]|uniref:Methyltransferase-like protein 7A n=1 Tax=Morella rubra TaxID=262757 RepID=A0A6A1V8E7_9ROSI|nr:Methyltransferase-like protein 7A [Morella rubra]
MVVYSSPARSFLVFLLPITPRPCCCSGYKPPRAKIPPISCCNGRDDNSFSAPKRSVGDPLSLDSFCSGISCFCSRRRFIDAAAVTTLLPTCCSFASNLHTDYTAVLKKVHPPRPDWYEEFYASVMDSSMKSYEAEIAGYKSQLFSNLKGKAQKVLEIGIGTGPNLKYYAGGSDVRVFGVDPNRKMEKYAQAAAVAAGLPLENFEFIQAVGEAIPLRDASVDAVVGTLVLCSVKDVDRTLTEVKRVLRPGGIYLFVEHVAAKEGTVLRFVQSVLDPLQQTVADGCHLTRETGSQISEAGFLGVELNSGFLSNAFFINPHVYGVAHK